MLPTFAWKLQKELMVLGHFDNHQRALSLGEGQVIEVLGPALDDRFVRIRAGGEVFEAFQSDVAERCAAVSSESKS